MRHRPVEPNVEGSWFTTRRWAEIHRYQKVPR
jgi:hypothetical protein